MLKNSFMRFILFNLSVFILCAIINSCSVYAQGELLPTQNGAYRVAIISDLNNSYGDTTYNWQIDTVSKYLKTWFAPNIVMFAGDVVAGQKTSLTDENLSAMWRGFDRYVLTHLHNDTLPYLPTIGNHDASAYSSYTREQAMARKFWKDKRHFYGFIPVDTLEYPFLYTCTNNEAGDIFILVVEASNEEISASELEWVKNQLESEKAKNAKMRIAMGHLPMYSLASGRDKPGEVLKNPDVFRKVLEEYNVHTYISGHHHAFYPGRRGDIELLSVGCAGSGARQVLGSIIEPAPSFTILDVFPDENRTEIYTYDITNANADNLELIDPLQLPEYIEGINGYIFRRDFEMPNQGAGLFSACHLTAFAENKTEGSVELSTENNQMKLSGSAKGFDASVEYEIGIYEAQHSEDGDLILSFASTSDDIGNIEFETAFESSNSMCDLLFFGGACVIISDKNTNEAISRAQLFETNESAPEKPYFTSHNETDEYVIEDKSSSIYILWNQAVDSDDNIVTFKWQLATDENFENIILENAPGTTNKYKDKSSVLYDAIVSNPAENNQYYHRVLASDGKFVTISEVAAVHLKPADAANINDKSMMNIHIFPNPANDVLFVNSNKEGKNLKINLLDINGKLLKTYNTERSKTQINVADLHTGVYFLIIKSGKQGKVEKVVVD